MYNTRPAGFTLIEISIVLVIIGLLAGGILKGQQMIDNARYNAWVKEIDAYRAAIHTFRDQYKYYPGDYPNAITKFSQHTGIVNGDGDGTIDAPAWSACLGYVAGCEYRLVFQHLMAAGLIKGDASAAYEKFATPVGGYTNAIVMADWQNGSISLRLHAVSVPAQFAKRLDEQFDDGNGISGNIVCSGGCLLTDTRWPGDDVRVNLAVML